MEWQRTLITVSTPKLLAAALAIPVALTAQSASAWSLLDNFDTYDNTVDSRTSLATGGTLATGDGGTWHSEFGDAGGITGNTHIVDSDQGQSLQVLGGSAWRGAEADLTQWGAGTAIGATNSYFYQAKWNSSAGGAFDIMQGLSPDVSNIDTNNAWQDFAVMPFFAGNGDGTADFKMADAGLANDDIITDATLDQWYNIWYVVDNSAETYDVYISTGTDDGVYVGTASIYRNGFTATDLNAIGFMAAGGAESELLVDNLYFAQGVDTTNPVPEPASLALIGIGGLSVLGRRRSKR